ncbi:MAG TPA: hypothetical protein VLH58_00825 [Candidatus Methylomirabilis sp.]|nr:hypothetical protein [Candidatus Methylomirabilis sp.]
MIFGPQPGAFPRILIAAPTLKRLKLYIDLCPFEVSGLGTVEPLGNDLLVKQVFLIRQRASDSDTELDSQAVADLLVEFLQSGGDPSTLRLWWHSHGDRPIFWSETDENTITSLHIEQLLSLVGNRRDEFDCRLDQFTPRRLTVDGLPLVCLPGGAPENGDALRRQVLAELREKVTLIHREVSTIQELLFDSTYTLETAIPFDEPEPRERD